MACFIVPLTQAVATTIYRKHREKVTNTQSLTAGSPKNSVRMGCRARSHQHVVTNTQLKTLEQMLWGGSLMLIVDHIINGEVTYMYPFFTALETEGGGLVMLREMLTVGVPMSVLVTLVWAVYCYAKERKTASI